MQKGKGIIRIFFLKFPSISNFMKIYYYALRTHTSEKAIFRISHELFVIYCVLFIIDKHAIHSFQFAIWICIQYSPLN